MRHASVPVNNRVPDAVLDNVVMVNIYVFFLHRRRYLTLSGIDCTGRSTLAVLVDINDMKYGNLFIFCSFKCPSIFLSIIWTFFLKKYWTVMFK